ncbi:MAG TPA: hypothetical protein VFX07_15860 [Candidatus Udaeobacter sp.]|jgi:uncharacterized repeat protein (TIGR01451 family)|nr:hypothetical protein [Candidatus Udaeobacter sp.]
MKRLTKTSLIVAIVGVLFSLRGSSPFVTTAVAQTQSQRQQKAEESTRDAPPDLTPYRRPAVREDFAPKGVRPIPLLPPLFIVDLVVNNTDPNLTNTDTFNDGETSITANPANPNEVVVTAFSGGWGANAPLWQTTDGGNNWTKQFTIPAPPGIAAGGCPCDQAVDYGTANQMSGTFLISDIFSGTTTDPASAAAWNWLLVGGVTQPTNFNNSPPPGGVDQPWLLVNADPTIPAQDNVYTAYDDFTNGSNCAGDACIERVSASYGVNPPNFTVDNQSGTSTGNINPGHRLAVDPRNGFVYSLFQRNIAGGAGGSKNIDYMLNRSTDGGATWILNGSAGGIIVANADSTQPTPKFGTVNALLGGVDHAAVDPNNGDVYYVYGNRDAGTGNNRLAIRRIQDNGGGGVTVGPENFVTGQVEAAIPSVAVASNGIVGVFYYSFDGLSPDGIPTFTAHLAQSSDQGITFSDQVLLTFLSSATDNGDNRQRVLGDYMQMKAVDTCFFGAFTGNGVAFGRPFANHDPIFFRVCVGEADLEITKSDSPDPVTTGSDLTYTITVTNNGPDAATSVTVTDTLPAETTFVSCSSTGGGVCGGSNNNRSITFASLASGQSETVTLVANVDCALADGSQISNTATVSSLTDDPNLMDNSATTTTTASNPPPTITGATADPSVLWPPNHRMVNVTVSYDVTDNCPLPFGSCTLSVTSNEPVLAHGSGHTSPDWIVVDDHHVLLRAERQGNGNGRIYTTTITCTDSGGNSSDEQVEVVVPHNRSRQ